MFVADINILSTPEKNLLLRYLQITESELDEKIQVLNEPCEQIIADSVPNISITDGMMRNLKTEYVTWQLWREYNNPDFEDKSTSARSDFFSFLNLLRENKWKQQENEKNSDLIKTKGFIII